MRVKVIVQRLKFDIIKTSIKWMYFIKTNFIFSAH